jgi:hypothetical protein
MADETQSSVRITNAQVYEKLMEVNAIQIEMIAELRNLKSLPTRVSRLEQEVARSEWIGKLAFTALGSGVAGFVAAIWSVIR